jgi:FMN phosphatase YigB (HAD superfamily)
MGSNRGNHRDYRRPRSLLVVHHAKRARYGAGAEAFTPELFKSILKGLQVKPEQTVFVGNRPEPEILSSNKARVISVRIRRGENRTQELESAGSTPKFEIVKLSDVFKILQKIDKPSSSG